MPLTEYSFSEENQADRLFYGYPGVHKAVAMCYYHDNGMVQHLIHGLKYRGLEKIGVFFGRWFGSKLKRDPGLGKVDFVLPVPLHWRKQKKRGYNQCAGFGRELAKALGARFSESLLLRRGAAATQTSKSRWRRWKGTEAAFHAPRPEILQGKRILLVDDVITTGATLGACCEALEQIPHRGIYIAAMAVVP